MIFKKCNHEQKQTVTNIYGDVINKYNGRSISKCINCGKEFIEDSLDKNCKRANTFNLKEFHLCGEELGDVSDGSHTFNELYYHRMILFSMVVNNPKHNFLAWKSWKHEDNTMFDDYFIVGITTPKGDYSYHYHKDYWDMFNVKELPNAPKWDGHKPSDIDRLLSL